MAMITTNVHDAIKSESNTERQDFFLFVSDLGRLLGSPFSLIKV